MGSLCPPWLLLHLRLPLAASCCTGSAEVAHITRLIRQRSDAVYNHGSIVLGAEGGPMYWLLVVTGLQRGKIWLVADVGAHPYPGPAAVGFVEWVQRWQAGDGWWD